SAGVIGSISKSFNISTARSTSCSLEALTPLDKYKLSSNPTRTLPPRFAASSTVGNCILPIPNADQCALSGIRVLKYSIVSASFSAPHGMPKQNWNIGSPSIRPSLTNCLATKYVHYQNILIQVLRLHLLQ